MSPSRTPGKSVARRRSSKALTTFLHRSLPLIPLLALALPLNACKPTVIGCAEEDADGAAVPGGSFEEEPTPWGLAAHSTIDGEQAVCDGSRSLRVELDQGLGSPEITRSAPLTGLALNKEYEVAFHYRFAHCKAATLVVQAGGYTHALHFEGEGGTWGETSFVFQAVSEPTTIDIHPERTGAATDYATAEFDDNLMWVDDFTITAL